MLKRKITEFTVDTGTERLSCSPPFGFSELLSGEATRVAATVRIEGADLAAAHLYLKLPYVGAPFALTVNGSTVATPDGGSESYVFDIKGYLSVGDNEVALALKNGGANGRLSGEWELLRTNYAVIKSLKLTQTHEAGAVTLGIGLEAVGSTDNVRAVATLVSGAGQLYYGGITRGSGSITVKDPLLWWPRGMGMQNLYKLTVNLYGDMEIEDTFECRVGLRTLDTTPEGDGSLLLVNGSSLLPMGAVYTPDRTAALETREKMLRAEIAAAASAGINTLIIPEESDPPTEELLSLCDAHGIIVIPEIDGLCREDAGRYASLSIHPSVGIFDVTVGNDEESSYIAMLKEANPDFRAYRFDAAESYPSAYSLAPETVLFAALPEGERNLFSESLEKGREREIHTALLHAADRYPYAGSLSDFAYVSELTQADIIGGALMRARACRGEGGRAVFRGLGCETELLSRSCLDGMGGMKALAFRARRCFSPVAAIAEYKNGAVAFTVTNESRKVFDGTLEYRIADKKNNTVLTDRKTVISDPSTSAVVGTAEIADTISGREKELYLEYTLLDGATPVYRDVMLFTSPKRFAFEDPEIRTSVSGADRRFTLAISASAFAKGVEISFGGVKAYLSDNFLDITSRSPVKLSVTTASLESAERLGSEIRVRSVYDLKKD